MQRESLRAALDRVTALEVERADGLRGLSTIAPASALDAALLALPSLLPSEGLGLERTTDLVLETIVPATATHTPRYYGFVTGGTLPAATVADHVVTAIDANVQVNLAREEITAHVDNLALGLVLDLLRLPRDRFEGRTFTTGATCVQRPTKPRLIDRSGSNILGLAVGREYAVKQRRGDDWSVAADGFGGVEIDVFTAGGHASLSKAAALVGIGRRRVVEVKPADDLTGCAFDLAALESALAESRSAGRGAIVVPSYGEVNTGAFTPEVPRVRELCDRYGAWLHIDGGASNSSFSVADSRSVWRLLGFA